MVRAVDTSFNRSADSAEVQATAAPRIHHQWRPDKLVVETSLAPAIVAALEKLGHHVERTSSVGITQAIGVSGEGSGLIGVHDPRVQGKAAAF